MKIIYEEIERGVFQRRLVEDDGTSHITRRLMDKQTAELHFYAESCAAKENGDNIEFRMTYKEKGQ